MKQICVAIACMMSCILYAQDVRVGSKIQFEATDKKLYIGTVLQVGSGEYYIQYDGYTDKAWIKKDNFIPVDNNQRPTIGAKVKMIATDGKIYSGYISEIKGDQYKIEYDGYNFNNYLTRGQFQIVDNEGLKLRPNLSTNTNPNIQDKTTKLSAKTAAQWNDQGVTYFNNKYYDSALICYNQALMVDPSYTYALNNRGLVYYYQGKYDASIADFSKLINMEPNKASGYSNRGLSYLYKGSNDLAISDFNKSLSLDPKYTDSWLNRGYIYFYMGKFSQAMSDYKEALKLDPKSMIGWNNLGLAYYSLNQYDEAINDFKQAIALTTNTNDLSRYYINLILVYLASDQYDNAASLYKSYKDKKMSSYVEAGKSYSFIKKYITACTDYIATRQYKKALELLQTSLDECLQANSAEGQNVSVSKEYSNVLVKTAWVYEQLGQKGKAVQYYAKAKIVNPSLSDLTVKMNQLNKDITHENVMSHAGSIVILSTPDTVPGQKNMVKRQLVGMNDLQVSGNINNPGSFNWVRVNGTEVKVDNLGFFSMNIKGDAPNFTIQAQDKTGHIEKITYQVEADTRGQNTTGTGIPPIPPEEPQKYHAVLIACSNYDGKKYNKLPSTIQEAKAYEDMLVNHYGFDKKNIVEIFDKNHNDIVSLLSSKIESLRENDNLVIMYAGHGEYEQRGGELIGYWVPLDASKHDVDYISNLNLQQLLLGCQARHVLLLSDACYSGAMRDGNNDAKFISEKTDYRYKSRQILTSGGLQKVPENLVFINSVLDVLKANDQKFLSAGELWNLIFKAIKNQSSLQPQLNPFGKDANEGGQFYFTKVK